MRVKLTDICKFQGGSQPPKSEWSNTTKNGYIRMLQIRDFTQGKDKYIQYVKETNKTKKCEESDILIGRYGASIGKILTGLKGAYNVAMMKITPTDEINRHYLYQYLNSNSFQSIINSIGSRAAQAGFNKDDLSNIEIPLPPLPKQKAIAEKLDLSAKLIALRKESIGKLDDLAKSVFVDMFGDPVENEMGWEVVKAEEHIDLLTGYPFKSKEYSINNNDIKLCGGLIISPIGIIWEKANFWNKNNTSHLEKYWLEVNDIVMAMDRPWISSGFKIYQIKDIDTNSLLVQRTARIRAKDTINSKFLFFIFKDEAFAIQSRITETTVPHISPNDIKNYNIILPPITLQNKFAQIIQKIEAQKNLYETELTKLEEGFEGLLQESFT